MGQGRRRTGLLFFHGCLEVVSEVDGFVLVEERGEVRFGDVVDCSFAHKAC